jgi:class 3 adenylate cyclase
VALTVFRDQRRRIGARRTSRRAKADGHTERGRTFETDIDHLIPAAKLCPVGQDLRSPKTDWMFDGVVARIIDNSVSKTAFSNGKRVERRLAAILAADVVGYSRLMGRDEIGTLARLRRHRYELVEPKVAEHKGKIVRTTGDGFLIEFHSVVEAVACAVKVQLAMAERNAETPDQERIVFRIGINLGDIIIEDDEIHGHGVNIAARLEPLAEPGGICVSATVHDEVRDKLDLIFNDMGEHVLKNIARARRIYRVLPGVSTNIPKDTVVDGSLKAARRVSCRSRHVTC